MLRSAKSSSFALRDFFRKTAASNRSCASVGHLKVRYCLFRQPSNSAIKLRGLLANTKQVRHLCSEGGPYKQNEKNPVQNVETLPETHEEIVDVKRDGVIGYDATRFLPRSCGGCGASFQTMDSSRPGFVSESTVRRHRSAVDRDVNALICKRCFDVRYHNKVPSLALSQRHAEKLLSSRLPASRGLILYLVDLLNVNGSTIPSVSNVLGREKRVIIVGTKMDMLPDERIDSRHKQAKRIRDFVKDRCVEDGLREANIKDVCLVSAKSGFGIDTLLNLINKHRGRYMPIYCIGCANSGKSSLFNAIQNLLTVYKPNVEMPSQSVTHYYPGTTLDLLKYPVTFSKIDRARRRLQQPVADRRDDQGILFDKDFIEDAFGPQDSAKVLRRLQQTTTKQTLPSVPEACNDYEIVNAESKRSDSNWIYDTPGIVRSDQIHRFLTPREVKFLQQANWIVPQTALLSPHMVLCIGGLVRIHYDDIKRTNRDSGDVEDVPKANRSIYFTVFCPHNVPLHVTTDQKAESVSKSHRKNGFLKIPFDYDSRGFEMPPMKPQQYDVQGIGWDQSTSDIAIHGLGWVGITAGAGSDVSLRVFTPDGVGQQLNKPSYFPHSIANRGKRGVRHLGRINDALFEGTRRSNPQLFEKPLDSSHIGEWMHQVEYRLIEQREVTKDKRRQALLDAGKTNIKENILNGGIDCGHIKLDGKPVIQESNQTHTE